MKHLPHPCATAARPWSGLLLALTRPGRPAAPVHAQPQDTLDFEPTAPAVLTLSSTRSSAAKAPHHV